MSTVAPLEVGGVVIEELDVRAMTDEQIAAGNDFGNLMQAESNPEDPPTPFEMTKASLENLPDFVRVRLFRGVGPDGDVVASAQASWTLTDDNQHVIQAGIRVLPEFRRRGIAKALLGLVVEVAEAEGRPLLLGNTSERVQAGAAFAQLAGAESALAVHENRLDMNDIDRELVKRWVGEGPSRAAGYSLVSVDGVYPDDMIEDIVDVYHVMNDAPRDNLDLEDQKITVEQFREMEKGMVATNTEHWSLFVRHDESGKLVGLTDVSWNAAYPETVWQGNTGVRPEHRGHALGKWLKAVMLQRILDDRPGIKEIRTGNADSNDAMLGINRELGFKPYIAAAAWQVTAEKVRDYLSKS